MGWFSSFSFVDTNMPQLQLTHARQLRRAGVFSGVFSRSRHGFFTLSESSAGFDITVCLATVNGAIVG
jgi:hypothetical protein